MGRQKSKRSVYVIVWEYRVKEGSEQAFESAYGPRGAWVQMMRQAEGYLGSDLIRGDTDSSRYLTVDRWVSPRAYERWRAAKGDEYTALDSDLQSLIEHERQVGDFVVAEDEAG